MNVQDCSVVRLNRSWAWSMKAEMVVASPPRTATTNNGPKTILTDVFTFDVHYFSVYSSGRTQSNRTRGDVNIRLRSANKHQNISSSNKRCIYCVTLLQDLLSACLDNGHYIKNSGLLPLKALRICSCSSASSTQLLYPPSTTVLRKENPRMNYCGMRTPR